jgi:hypothetical protein
MPAGYLWMSAISQVKEVKRGRKRTLPGFFLNDERGNKSLIDMLLPVTKRKASVKTMTKAQKYC